MSDRYHGLTFQRNDGGRLDAGFKGSAGDCVTRSITIATGENYRRIYNDLGALAHEMTGGLHRTARGGVATPIFHRYLTDRGWQLYRTDGEYLSGLTIPMSRVVICVLHRHMATAIDGTLCDSWDSRHSTRTKSRTPKLLGIYLNGGL